MIYFDVKRASYLTQITTITLGIASIFLRLFIKGSFCWSTVQIFLMLQFILNTIIRLH